MESWSDFGVAVTGAGAALIGLLFVSMSINLRQIVTSASLPSRAAFALLLLVVPTLSAMLLLVPQHPLAYGVELLVLSLALGPPLIHLARPGPRPAEQPRATRIGAVVVTVLTVGGTVVAGVLLVAGSVAGAHGIVVSTVAAFGGALTNTWVLLVEILR